jgi:hypothetical protein
MGSHGLGASRLRKEAGTQDSKQYALEDMKTSGKNKRETYADLSHSESQERIVPGTKTQAYVTTTGQHSGSASGSEEFVLQGITVTTDVKVVRS